MTAHLKHSRIAKALTDRANGAPSFLAAERRLEQTRVAVVLAPDQAQSRAGQAAALTAVNTSIKCFGNATLVVGADRRLIRPLPFGADLSAAVMALGGQVTSVVPADISHVIALGIGPDTPSTAFVRCWWNGWTAGILPPWDDRQLGLSGNALAGIFAGALAVREVFATVLGYPRCGARVSITSLWDPGESASPESGPMKVYFPSRLWFIGLGHLGQGYLWALGFLPKTGEGAVVQDDQVAGEENEATGLLTKATDIDRKKARIAADWLEGLGWPNSVIERRHYGDIPLLDHDPTIVVTGLDAPAARMKIASAGFDYMVDAGVGHGPVDFESIQIRVLKKGMDPSAFWASPVQEKHIDALLQREAYATHENEFDGCGTFSLAAASVAVPFVGAATGALVLAQLARLGSLQTSRQIMQVDLGTPAMVTGEAINEPPSPCFGTLEADFS